MSYRFLEFINPSIVDNLPQRAKAFVMQIERAQEVGLRKPNAGQKNIFQDLLLFKKKD
ncbi:MAG: hypothetical protein ISQ57_02495 [Litoricola sp.]|jgi:hypothetical protein|nr:hypothetical protein [Litorivicinus sp.]MDA8664929.1 hypothetical protein [Litorivicinaceae bacterium]